MKTSSTVGKCHTKALSDTIELSLLASFIALVADMMWLLHDVYTNGGSLIYIFIFTGLMVGISLTGIALKRHHTSSVRELLRTLMADKIKVQKHKNKHTREHGHGH